VGQSDTGHEAGASPRWRGGWRIKLLILGGLIVLLAGGSIAWAARVSRHQASTYGIDDPASAALRVENRTSDFAITHVSIEDAEAGRAVRDVQGEIGAGAGVDLEIAPGTYLVKVFYVEINQAVADRPKGFLSESCSVSPGKAVVLCLQGGAFVSGRPDLYPPQVGAQVTA